MTENDQYESYCAVTLPLWYEFPYWIVYSQSLKCSVTSRRVPWSDF